MKVAVVLGIQSSPDPNIKTMLLRPRRLVLSSLAVLTTTTMMKKTTANSILDALGLTDNGIPCPADCPLCQCIANTTDSIFDVDACARAKSIEACSSGTLGACYNHPGSTSGGGTTTMDVNDVAGMCDVQCGGEGGNGRRMQMIDLEGLADASSIQCRLCEIFSCCGSCPSDKAMECFPPTNVEDGGGYTPAGWEPPQCDGGNDPNGDGDDRVDSNGDRRAAAIAFVVGGVPLVLAACFAIASVVV